MRRIIELDTLRGMLLVVMTFTHLPTRLSHYADQPLGFVSTAEAFIFLSACLAGRAYSSLHLQGRGAEVRRRAWTRCRKMYLWHLALLFAVFVLGTALVSSGGRPLLQNLLSVYSSDPLRAAAAAVIMVYQPPLLDILPMYIVFLALTPLLLEASVRQGWARPLALSALLWLFAQLDGRALLFHEVQALARWPFPLESLGSFDWFAWQALWVAGLALGCNLDKVREWMRGRTVLIVLSAAITIALFFVRHQYGNTGPGGWLGPMTLDKWHLGPLRLVNFVALGVLVALIGLPLLKDARFKAFTLLGRASLEVFCVHVLACVLCLSLVREEGAERPLAYEALMVCGTLLAMFAVAQRTTQQAGRGAGGSTEISASS